MNIPKITSFGGYSLYHYLVVQEKRTNYTVSDVSVSFKKNKHYYKISGIVDDYRVTYEISNEGVILSVTEQKYYYGGIDRLTTTSWALILAVEKYGIEALMNKYDIVSYNGGDLLDEYEKYHQAFYREAIFNLLIQQRLDLIRFDSDEQVDMLPIFEWDRKEDGYRVRFKIGVDKMTFVKNFEKTLLTPLLNSEAVELNSKTTVILTEERFTERGRRCLEFIKRNRGFWVKDSQIMINNHTISDYVHLFSDDDEFGLTLWNKKLGLHVVEQDESSTKIEFNTNGLQKFGYSTEFMYGETLEGSPIYAPVTKWDSYIIDMFLNTRTIFLTNEQFQQLNEVLQDERTIFELIIDDQIKVEIPERLQFRVDMNESDDLVIEVRGKSEDSRIFNQINTFLESEYGAIYQSDSSTFFISNEESRDQFIFELLPQLNQLGDVYVSQTITNIARPRRVPIKLGVSVSKGYLQLSIDSDELDVNEIQRILKSYRQKQKYHLLGNGERIAIHQEQFQALDELLQELDLKKVPVRKERVPAYRYYQIKEMAQEFIEMDFDEKFLAMSDRKPEPIAKKILPTLREYQVAGVEWLLTLRKMELAGILADDMGLGKSLQLIAYLWSTRTKNSRASLIVAPASLLYNWEAEFKKFNAPFEVTVVTGNSLQREQLIEHALQNNCVLVTSYDYLRRDQELYQAYQFDTLVLDEAHYIKNHHTKSSAAVKNLKADYRLAMTGTPIENSLAELWSIFDFLMPGYLYTYHHFSKMFECPIVKEHDEEKEQRLKELVSPFVMRRLKKDTLHELPDKVEESYFVALSEEEQKIYQANLVQANQALATELDLKQSSIQVLALLTRLRQLAIDPRLIYDDIKQPSSKINATVELIQQVILNKQSVLLFSAFTSGLALIEEALQKVKIPYVMITGSTSKEKRRDAVELFQAGEVPVFLISLKAGGTGLNLTKASTVIHLDPWWNISAQNQATDRAHRMGQDEKVTVYKMISKGTIEEKIELLQADKKALSDAFIEQSTGAISQLSDEEIRNLFV
ncbi:SNF2 helicase associated domain-containing protein [Tuanshanicoccus lijuaniae]|uniref:SNF2-related protein n=1 Tax=Aerococcaceae bacterium zg-1292 TaxID=2774330 RepID=UPI00193851C0|nr:SNF2 helicase associated domain-containing protein [Aerococcaceae bacterium zg-1292]QQA36481.1 SNF2 helicase associated domain-containing protein [Aerococcaceae bacterium zg-1292]